MKKLRFVLILLSLIFLGAPLVAADMGEYLKDSKGMTLYWFTKDGKDMSACMGGCLEKWPIFYDENAAASMPGTDPEDFGTLTRSDGKMQTTFRGYPLYYFFKDMAAGDENGEGMKGVWYMVDPDNFPPK